MVISLYKVSTKENLLYLILSATLLKTNSKAMKFIIDFIQQKLLIVSIKKMGYNGNVCNELENYIPI